MRLSEEDLIRHARELVGLHDFGNDGFRENLRRLLQQLAKADLNADGNQDVQQTLIGQLANRLLAEDQFRQHPEILQRKIFTPIVIVAPARSGTTRLHRMLATDPRFAHLRCWEAWCPAPWNDSHKARANRLPEPRVTYVENMLKRNAQLNPVFASIHPVTAMEAEEEFPLLNHSFCPPFFGIGQRRESVHESQVLSYDYMAKLLKLISWWRHDDPDKPWILKTPQHLRDLDALMNVFPDAKLIFIHRDPVKVIGSGCSLDWYTSVLSVDRLDPSRIGIERLEQTDMHLRKTLKLRETIPASQQLDILYADMSADWVAVVRKIYDFIGYDFTAEVKAGMVDWLAVNGTDKRPGHRYRLERYDLHPADVEARFEYYRQRFGIPYE